MTAITLVFMGQFALSTSLRPFLENVTGLDVNILSMFLLVLGLAGFAGTSLVGLFLRSHLNAVLVGLPVVLSITALLLMGFGPSVIATAALLIVWGLFTTPIPVAWNTWMTRVIPDDLEAGGGLQVALIQFAIMAGAFVGGLLFFDGVGWGGGHLRWVLVYSSVRRCSPLPRRGRAAKYRTALTFRGAVVAATEWIACSRVDRLSANLFLYPNRSRARPWPAIPFPHKREVAVRPFRVDGKWDDEETLTEEGRKA